MFFFGATTIGAHQSVRSVTGAIMSAARSYIWLLLELFPVGQRYPSWCGDTEGLGVLSECYSKAFTRHALDLTVKYRGNYAIRVLAKTSTCVELAFTCWLLEAGRMPRSRDAFHERSTPVTCSKI